MHSQDVEMAEKQSKKIRTEQKNKSITARVNIGVAFQRWRELRQLKGLKTDEEVAIFLLESYEKEIYIYTPYTDEKSGQSLPPMSSLGSQCLRDDYNIKEEKELEKSTSSAIEELEVSIDWEDGVSERQDSDTDSADPDYECVSDELIINTDGAYPDSEEVDTTTDDANPEYECVSDELNTDTGVVDPDDDRVSEELNIYTDSEDPDSEGVSEKMENDTDSDDPDYSCTEEPLRTVISRGIEKTIKLPEREHRSFLEQPQERLPELQNQHKGLPRLKKNHNCVICGKVFSNSAGLRRHHVIHTGKRPFNCSICEKGFTQSGNLRTHMKVHIGKVPNWRLLLEKSPPKESPVTVHVCGQCGMEFPQKEQLEEHSQSHKKPYECPDCRKTFKNEDYFELHKRIHSGDLPFLCSECGKGFVTAVLLKQHEYTHTGEKNFHCDHCGRAFSKAFNLKLHLRTHTGERPHLCSVCGKSYSRADILKAHLRVHTGEKPYICEKCGKCFHYHQGYQQHMRSHNKKPKPQTKQLGRPKQQ